MVERRERVTEGLQICEEIVAGPAEPKEKAAALRLLIDLYRRQSKWDEALKAAERLRQAFPQDKDVEQTALLAQVDIYRQAKKDAAGIAKAREFLERQPQNKVGGAEARVRIAEFLLNAKQYAECQAEAAKAIDLDPQNDSRVAEALWHMQEAAWRADDVEKCLAPLGRLLEPRYLAKRESWQQRELRQRYGQALRRMKRFDEARAHYAALEKAETDPRVASEWCQQVADTFADEGRLDDALRAYERVFVAWPDVLDSWAGVQRKIVESLVKKGALEEAIKAARVCLDAATDDKGLADQVRLVAEIFKSMDKNLGRANALINYHRSGPDGEDGKPGTDDDLKNPLDGYPYPAYPERDRAFAEARKRAGDDARAMRFRALTYLYSGHPKEALRCFMDAFGRCMPDELQQTGQDMILLGARAVRGHAVGLDGFFHFVNYGPAGPDGRLGTADDLADPFAPLLK